MGHYECKLCSLRGARVGPSSDLPAGHRCVGMYKDLARRLRDRGNEALDLYVELANIGRLSAAQRKRRHQLMSDLAAADELLGVE